MSETAKPYTSDNPHKPEDTRKPDNITKSQRDGTTYTIREFMVGKESAADIVVRRVIRELSPDVPVKQIP